MISDDEYRVLFELRQIPQRKDDYMTLRDADAAIAEGLSVRGMVDVLTCEVKGLMGFRLLKMGRDVLVGEWLRRGKQEPAANL